ncbi:hypothetical protein D3C75_770820 [compost metagenome]
MRHGFCIAYGGVTKLLALCSWSNLGDKPDLQCFGGMDMAAGDEQIGGYRRPDQPR